MTILMDVGKGTTRGAEAEVEHSPMSYKPSPRVAEVKRYLLLNYYGELHTGSQVQRRHLEDAIMKVRGKDPRTVKTWLKAFHRMKLIKPIAGEVWEIL